VTIGREEDNNNNIRVREYEYECLWGRVGSDRGGYVGKRIG